MTSIIKVDQIQTAAGSTPTAADLGVNISGSLLQVVEYHSRLPFTINGAAIKGDNIVVASCPPPPSPS